MVFAQVGVVIPTVDRPASLRRVVRAMHEQTLPPAQVVISPPNAALLPEDIANDPLITVVDGFRGAAAQRNAAVRALVPEIEFIGFFDDDAVPREDFLERALEVLQDNADVVALTGRVARDGVDEKRELNPDEIEQALAESWIIADKSNVPHDQLYGANMFVRAEPARQTPFDERLPLYSWLEDLDFCRRLMRYGRIVKANGAVIVHQGSDSGGRRQHRRLGYSQVANYAYLLSKGTARKSEVVRLVVKPLLASARGSVIGNDKEGRRDRLSGMVLACGDVLRGRLTPERIVDL